MKTDIKRAEDSTLTLTITVPWDQVELVRKIVVDEAVETVEVPGFRKGRAPKNLAEKKLSREQIQEEVLKRVVTDTYNAAIKTEKIAPIVNPQIHIEAFEEGTNLTYTAETCEEPKVALNNYKDAVKNLTAKSKIIKPGEAETPKPKLEEIVEVLTKTATVAIPKILIETEANRLLSQLLDEIKTLGLTLDQYISSRGKKIEDVRLEYESRAERDLKLEFILRAVADEEQIKVDEKDVEAVMATIKDENQKRELSQSPYLFAALIRQQKTLDFLSKI